MQSIAIPSNVAGFFFYLLVLVPVIALEHVTLGRFLKQQEFLRRAIGIVTVWLLMPLVALFTSFDWFTWIVAAVGFFAAGMVMILIKTIEDVIANNNHVAELRRRFDEVSGD